MTVLKSLDKKSLEQVAKQSETAEGVFHVLAQRERARGETDLRRLRTEMTEEGFKAVPEDLLGAFRSLEKLGIGELRLCAGGTTKFRWNYSLRDVSLAAVGATKPEHKARGAVGRPVPRPALEPVTIQQNQPLTRTVIVALGTGRYVKVEAPNNITKEEITFVFDVALKQAK